MALYYDHMGGLFLMRSPFNPFWGFTEVTFKEALDRTTHQMSMASTCDGNSQSEMTTTMTSLWIGTRSLIRTRDVYRLQTDDFDEPEALEVFYDDGKGSTVREIVFIDPIYAERRPRICVSIDGIQAMHNTISCLTRKVDNLVATLSKCRSAYYKELTTLKEQLYQQAIARKDGRKHSIDATVLFDPSAFQSQTSQEVEMEVKQRTEKLTKKLTEAQVENLRLKKRIAILTIEVTQLAQRSLFLRVLFFVWSAIWMLARREPQAKAEPRAATPSPKKAAKTSKAEVAGGEGSLVPFGANFVRQDLRRGKGGASKRGTQNSRRLNQMYGKDGRLKSKYARAPQPLTTIPVTRRQEKAVRHQHQQVDALRRSSMLKISSKRERRTFSSAMTEDLLASIQDPAEDVAAERPPDAVGEETTASHSDWMPSKDRPAGTYSAADLTAVLQEVFGHEAFRPGQREAILSVLASHHTLLLLATGSGKSLCYQLPAYLLREEGFTLVVSPLISLMSDQLVRLPGCLRGAICSGQQTRESGREVMRAVRARLVDVLFVSPERLATWSFDGCGLPPIALACIDEAHCVSEWSHNFRPDYLRLHEYVVGALGAKRVLALTATATRPTVKSVCDILRLDTVVRSDRSFTVEELMQEPTQPTVQRSNLTMDVRSVPDAEFQVRELINILRNEVGPSESVVVYVWRRATADQLAKQLRPYVRGGVNAYHGSMLADVRSTVQENFMSGKVKVVVATVAFGMGLDKPDIRTVVHFGLPMSIENYIQETGRCARDGAPGKCVVLAARQDFRAMRWVQSAGTGGSTQAAVVRRLLVALLGDSQTYKRHILSEEALTALGDWSREGEWQPYSLAFEEKEAAKEMNCSTEELHSVLAHLCRHARSHLTLMSSFPTKLKLRFFRTDPAELVEVDPLLRKVLPLAKKNGPVYTLDTAKAMATLGGTAGQLSNGLWQAQGDEFSVEKAEYGYMLAVRKPVTEDQIKEWAEQISQVNVRARESAVEKLDASFIVLTRAADASDRQKVSDPDAEVPAAHTMLHTLINAYFAAVEDPSAVVAGSAEERRRVLASALGTDFGTSVAMQARPLHQASTAARASTGATQGASQLHSVTVVTSVFRLLLDPAWPNLPCEELEAVVRAVAQFLAGVSSVVLPASKWREHRLWGHLRGVGNGDFQYLEELVREGVLKFQKTKKPRLG
ncbi:RECQL4 [Symbiodinium natans]|uniref:DNA 3'-5' helicase n=1 Tax=Symbiodinium natans TaxID=878477 RepID=A0A812G681_9DINO|nr:RECQL4 [Symbiodinium natans]